MATFAQPAPAQLRRYERTQSRDSHVEQPVSMGDAFAREVHNGRPAMAWRCALDGSLLAVAADSTHHEQRNNDHSRRSWTFWATPFNAATNASMLGCGRFKADVKWRGLPAGDAATSHQSSRALAESSLAGHGQSSAADNVQYASIVRVLDAHGDGRTTFEDLVRRAEAACRDGEVQKIVVARRARWRATSGGFDVAATVDALVAAHPESTVFAVTDGKGGVFAGATPEILARYDGRTAYTHALAGTARRTDDVDEAGATLLASLKDRYEHQVVVDDIAARLASLSDELGVGPGPRIRTLSTLLHLETPITCTLQSGRTLRDVIDALHPTSAVCGLPRDDAQRWLAAHEGWDRGLYAGHIGFERPDGSGAAVVAIRSVHICGDIATTFAGAGIVAGSDPAAEWRETQWKMNTAAGCLRPRGAHAR